MKLIEFYQAVVEFAGCVVDAEGYIKIKGKSGTTPLTIDNKPVVLPTKEHLKNAVGKILFHPLRENLMSGESDVVKALRKVLIIRFNTAASAVCNTLLHIASDTEVQKTLSPEQLEVLTVLGDVDAKAVKTFIDITLAGFKRDSFSGPIVHLYNRRGALLAGTKYARVCKVHFPIYEEIKAGGDKIMGVKVRQKDKDTYSRLFHYVFPAIDEEDGYSAGSNSRLAPFFEATMSAAQKIASALNDVIEQYRDHIEGADELIFNNGWAEMLDRLGEFKRDIAMIPAQAGNESHEEVEAPKVATVAPSAPVSAPSAAVATAAPSVRPIDTPSATTESSKGTLTVKELLERQFGPQVSAPIPSVPPWVSTPAPMGPPAVKPSPSFGAPGMGYPQMPWAQAPQGYGAPPQAWPMYPSAPMGYPQPNAGYPQPAMGYPQPQGYPSAMPGYAPPIRPL